MRITAIPFPVLRLQYRIARAPLELFGGAASAHAAALDAPRRENRPTTNYTERANRKRPPTTKRMPQKCTRVAGRS